MNAVTIAEREMLNAAFDANARAASKPEPCHCAAYRHPHRFGGGKCPCVPGEQLCAGCGFPADTITVDEGYGRTEAWGCVTDHVLLVELSDCCECELVDNDAGESSQDCRHEHGTYAGAVAPGNGFAEDVECWCLRERRVSNRFNQSAVSASRSKTWRRRAADGCGA